MRRRRHTEDERKAIIERVHTSGRSLAEIAAEEGVSRQTLQSWMRASPRQRGSFIEVPARNQKFGTENQNVRHLAESVSTL